MIFDWELLRTYVPERGSFRGLMRAALTSFMRNTVRDAGRKKRGGGVPTLSLDDPHDNLSDAIPDAAALTPDQIFDVAWNQVVMGRAVAMLEKQLVFDEAERDLKKAQGLLKKMGGPWVREAVLHTARAKAMRSLGGDPARARVAAAYALDRALAIDPTFGEAWLALAELEDERGNPERARVAAEQALRLNKSLVHRLTRPPATQPGD